MNKAKETSKNEAPYTPKPKSVIRDYFEQGLITVTMALFLMTFIAQAVEVPTGSMQNTIWIGDHLFVNKFVFGKRTSWLGPLQPSREIRRGDIAVFKLPSDPRINYVKRVIGLPGDRVQVRGRRVFVNEQELPEQRLSVKLSGDAQFRSALEVTKTEPPPPGATYKTYHDEQESDMLAHGAKYAVKEPFIVPDNSYFMMGDSRDNSLDSRYWGAVPRSNIVARALYVHWSYNPRDPDAKHYGFPLIDILANTYWSRTGAAVK